MGLFFIKLSLIWKWNLWCTPAKAHNMDTNQLVIGDKKELIL